MNITTTFPPLSGIIPPMVTPLLDRDTLDVAGLEKLIEHILTGGVHGLFVLGTTGEAPSIGYRVRKELIAKTCKQVNRRIPVLVGITDTAFVESLDIARHSADCGAHAVVLAPPYYFPAGQPELLEYVEHLTAELPLPLMLYNMPMMTKVSFEPATVHRLTNNKKIIGVKDSSGDLAYFDQIMTTLKQRPDWKIFMGPEALIPECIARGGHGGVSGGANLHPKLYVDLYNACVNRNQPEIARLIAQVRQLGEMYAIGKHASAIIKAIKCALSLTGICSDVMAEPFSRFAGPEREKVRAMLEKMNLLRQLA